MNFPGAGKSARLVEKKLTGFLPVFVCLLKLLVFNLLITSGYCLLRKQDESTRVPKLFMKSSFVV